MRKEAAKLIGTLEEEARVHGDATVASEEHKNILFDLISMFPDLSGKLVDASGAFVGYASAARMSSDALAEFEKRQKNIQHLKNIEYITAEAEAAKGNVGNTRVLETMIANAQRVSQYVQKGDSGRYSKIIRDVINNTTIQPNGFGNQWNPEKSAFDALLAAFGYDPSTSYEHLYADNMAINDGKGAYALKEAVRKQLIHTFELAVEVDGPGMVPALREKLDAEREKIRKITQNIMSIMDYYITEDSVDAIHAAYMQREKGALRKRLLESEDSSVVSMLAKEAIDRYTEETMMYKSDENYRAQKQTEFAKAVISGIFDNDYLSSMVLFNLLKGLGLEAQFVEAYMMYAMFLGEQVANSLAKDVSNKASANEFISGADAAHLALVEFQK